MQHGSLKLLSVAALVSAFAATAGMAQPQQFWPGQPTPSKGAPLPQGVTLASNGIALSDTLQEVRKKVLELQGDTSLKVTQQEEECRFFVDNTSLQTRAQLRNGVSPPYLCVLKINIRDQTLSTDLRLAFTAPSSGSQLVQITSYNNAIKPDFFFDRKALTAELAKRFGSPSVELPSGALWVYNRGAVARVGQDDPAANCIYTGRSAINGTVQGVEAYNIRQGKVCDAGVKLDAYGERVTSFTITMVDVARLLANMTADDEYVYRRAKEIEDATTTVAPRPRL